MFSAANIRQYFHTAKHIYKFSPFYGIHLVDLYALFSCKRENNVVSLKKM